MNLFDGIERQARERPDATALVLEQSSMSFAQLELAARRASSALTAQGLVAGDVVELWVGSAPLQLVLVLALARLGAISTVLGALLPRRQRIALARRLGIRTVVADGMDGAIEGCRTIAADPAWLQPPEGAGASHAAPAAVADALPWRLCMTSGTTGRPKAVALRHAQFARIAELRGQEMKVRADSVFLSRIDVQTSPVLIRCLTHLLAGSAVCIHQGKLAEVFEAIERHRVTHIYISPRVLHAWLNALPQRPGGFAALTHLGVGGGNLSAELCRAAMTRLTPHLFVSYGSTESGAIARADSATLRDHPESAGRVVPWAQVQVVDDADRPLPAGESGLLRVRGEEVASGYFGGTGDAAASRKFRDGWYYTGDVGRLTEEGLLFVAGRNDDVVNLGGPGILASTVEAALVAHPAVAEAAVFGVNDPTGRRHLGAAIVPRGRIDKSVMEELRNLKGRGTMQPLLVMLVRELPRNAMGKVLKHQLASRVKF